MKSTETTRRARPLNCTSKSSGPSSTTGKPSLSTTCTSTATRSTAARNVGCWPLTGTTGRDASSATATTAPNPHARHVHLMLLPVILHTPVRCRFPDGPTAHASLEDTCRRGTAAGPAARLRTTVRRIREIPVQNSTAENGGKPFLPAGAIPERLPFAFTLRCTSCCDSRVFLL